MKLTLLGIVTVFTLLMGCGMDSVTGVPYPDPINPADYTFVEADLAFRALEGLFVPEGSLGVLWRTYDGDDFYRYILYLSADSPTNPMWDVPRISIFEAEQDRDVFGGATRDTIYYVTLVVYTTSGYAYYAEDIYYFGRGV